MILIHQSFYRLIYSEISKGSDFDQINKKIKEVFVNWEKEINQWQDQIEIFKRFSNVTTLFYYEGSNIMKTQNLSISSSTIGILNTEEIKDVEKININISALANSPQTEEIAEALKSITEAVALSGTLSTEKKSDIIEQVEEISRQALLPPEQRSKGVIKATLGGIAAGLGAAGGLAEVWSTWGNKIITFFGL